jgi:hypothetical protein
VGLFWQLSLLPKSGKLANSCAIFSYCKSRYKQIVQFSRSFVGVTPTSSNSLRTSRLSASVTKSITLRTSREESSRIVLTRFREICRAIKTLQFNMRYIMLEYFWSIMQNYPKLASGKWPSISPLIDTQLGPREFGQRFATKVLERNKKLLTSRWSTTAQRDQEAYQGPFAKTHLRIATDTEPLEVEQELVKTSYNRECNLHKRK